MSPGRLGAGSSSTIGPMSDLFLQQDIVTRLGRTSSHGRVSAECRFSDEVNGSLLAAEREATKGYGGLLFFPSVRS